MPAENFDFVHRFNSACFSFAGRDRAKAEVAPEKLTAGMEFQERCAAGSKRQLAAVLREIYEVMDLGERPITNNPEDFFIPPFSPEFVQELENTASKNRDQLTILFGEIDEIRKKARTDFESDRDVPIETGFDEGIII